MKISLSKEIDYGIYDDLISLCNEIKLTCGPLGLESSLSKHPKIKSYLISCQKQYISEYEKMIVDKKLLAY